MGPNYTTSAGGRLVWIVIAMTLAGAGVALLLVLALSDASAGLITSLIAVGAGTAVVVLLLPRRYEVWPDRLTLRFLLWSWNVDLDTIDHVREATSYEPYAFAGIRFATAPSQAVTVIRRGSNMFRRPNLVISPRDRDEFLPHLQSALAARRAKEASA